MEPDPQSSAPRRVEAYLDQVLAPLSRRLSTFHRAELRRELKAHLWARVDAYQELGMTETEAVTEALRQFGGAADFTRQWRQEWFKLPARLTLRDIYEAGRQALIPSLAGVTAAMVPFGLLTLAYHILGVYMGFVLDENGIALYDIASLFGLLIMPVLIGARQGRRSPKNAGIGMTAALLLETMAAGLIYQASDWISHGSGAVNALLTILLAMLIIWMPIAGSAASLSDRWTQRLRASQIA